MLSCISEGMQWSATGTATNEDTDMTKLNFDDLDTNEKITLAIGEVAVESETLQHRIHLIVVAVGVKWAKDGDQNDAVTHMNTLIEKLGAGVRKNALVEYATSKKLFAMVMHETDKVLVKGGMKHTDLDIRLIVNTKWFDFREPPVAKAWNLVTVLGKLCATGTTKSAKPAKIDTIDPVLLAELVAILARVEAAEAELNDGDDAANEPNAPAADPLENVG